MAVKTTTWAISLLYRHNPKQIPELHLQSRNFAV